MHFIIFRTVGYGWQLTNPRWFRLEESQTTDEKQILMRLISAFVVRTRFVVQLSYCYRQTYQYMFKFLRCFVGRGNITTKTGAYCRRLLSRGDKRNVTSRVVLSELSRFIINERGWIRLCYPLNLHLGQTIFY